MQATSKRKSEPLVEADWIHAARRILIEEGIKGLSLRRLAAALGVTTGAFYWLFGNFDDLLDKLRQDWDNKSAVRQGLSVILPRLLLKDEGELRTFKFKWLNGNLTPG